ncbi:hypothetical protein M9Y10_006331 [Tritrichomonas musculus]|uniref:Serine/threonine-protein phosphatase n=1 Tax=Tritrichomonas musculus TaxID=1915356 RepID=A0ABR2JG26_9EUKA
MARSASYIFSAYSFINKYPLEKLLEVGHQSKEGNPIPSFDEDLLIELCSDAQQTFENEENILEIDGDIIIVGDIHGSFHDLLRILNFIQETDSKVLFLGDYVDRGSFSLECVTLLFALKILRPNNFYLLRGNHEFDSMCSQYGFKDEILNYHNPKKIHKKKIIKKSDSNSVNLHLNEESTHNKEEEEDTQCDEYYPEYSCPDCYKYSEKLYDAFIEAFSFLPIGAIVNQTTFCIHGGLSPRIEHLESLKKGITRPIYTFEENSLFSDVVWSDPSSNFPFLFCDNPRGKGFLFNSNATDLFLLNNSLKRIIRAHECVKHGSSTHFDKKCITVFSASSYIKDMGNKSGVLRLFENEDKIEFISFEPIKRLQKSDTCYFKVQNFNNTKTNQKILFSIRHSNLNTPIVSGRKRLSQRYVSPQRSDLSNAMFVTNARRKNSLIQKPIIHHSVSMHNFNTENQNNGIKIPTTKSMVRFSDNQDFSGNS